MDPTSRGRDDDRRTAGRSRARRRRTSHGREGGDDFWLAQAEILLSGLLWVAAASPLTTMADVVEWVLTQDRLTEQGQGVVSALLGELLTGEDPDVASALGQQ